MANFSALKTAIQNAIKQNGNEEITGDVLQQILLSIVSTMGDGAINTIEQNLSNETTTRQSADNNLQSNINAEAGARQGADTQLQNAINAIKANIDNGYVYAGIATPSSTPVSGKVFYIATAAGTYTNFGGQVLTQGINILRFNGSAWSSQQLIGIDDVPTAGSTNLVESGGVQNELALGAVYDVSAKNPTGGPNNDGKWESLFALLSDANLNTLIPTAYRKGGMSIKFVHSSDNKYVQARCIANSFTTDITKWQGVDDNVTLFSNNLVESNAVAEEVTFVSSAIGSIQSTNYCRIVNGNYVRSGGTYQKYKGVSFPKMNAGDKLIFQITGNDSVNNAFDIGEFTFSSGQYNPTDNQQALTSITGTVSDKITYTMQNDANVVICLSRDLTVSLIKEGKTVKEAIEDIEDEIGDITGDISTIQEDVTNIKTTLNSADDTVEYGSEDLVKSGAVAKETALLSEPPASPIQTANYARIIDGHYVRNAGSYANYYGVSFYEKMSSGDKLIFNLTGTDATNINYEVGEFTFVQAQYIPTDNQQALAYVSGVINGSTVFYTMQNDANVVICLSRQFTVTLQKQTGTVKEKVIELGSRMNTAESEISSLMPTQPYIAEAEEATKDAQAYPADLKLAVFSDPHTWRRTTYQVFNEINKLGTIDFIAGLGDYQPYDAAATKEDSMPLLAKVMSIAGRNLGLYAIGNHDIVPSINYVNAGNYDEDTSLTKNEVFDCFNRHLNRVAVFDEDNPYGGYYYVDFSASKVRVIVLNTSDIWNSAGTITKHYKQAMTIQQKQVDWFMSKALNFSNVQNKEDWGVLVLSHNIANQENLPSVIIPILVAFKNGEAINTSVTLNTAYGSEEKDVISIVHDFTQQGSMDVIGSLEGHTHVYREYPTNTPTIGARQIREVTFDADNKAFNEFYQKEFDSLPAGEYYFVAAAVTLVFTLSDSYNDVIFKYKRYGIGTTRQAGFSIIDKDSGDVLYSAAAVEGTPSAGATELTGFVTDMPDGTANTEQCYIVGIDRTNRILHITPYGHGTEKTVNY